MICANIDKAVAVRMLINRVMYWTHDDTTLKLFYKYYEEKVTSSAYNGCNFDVMFIVDNDYVSNFRVWTREELDCQFSHEAEDRRLERIYAENGDGDERKYLVYVG